MFETNTFHKWRFSIYLSILSLICSIGAIAFTYKILSGLSTAVFKDIIIIVILGIVAFSASYFLLKLCNLRIFSRGVEINNNFYDWCSVENLVFIANGLVLLKFINGKRKFSLISYGWDHKFLDFYDEISVRVNSRKYGFRWHPYYGKFEKDSPYYEKNNNNF